MNKQTATLDNIIEDIVRESIDEKLSELKAVVLSVLNSSANYPEYMDLGLACEYLSVSRNTLAKFIKEYGLPVRQIDGIKRIAKSDLDEFMFKF